MIRVIWGGKNHKVVGLVGGGWAVRVAKVVWLACMVRLVRVDRAVRLVRLVYVVRLVRLACRV